MLDDQTLQPFCDEASAEIDAKLGGRYAVPFVPDVDSGELAPLVVKIAINIAAYLATLEFYNGQPMENTNPIYLRYSRAEMLLGQVQSGAAVIIQPADQGQEPSSTEATVVNPYNGDLFPMQGFGLSGMYDDQGRWFPPYPR